jgi:CDP-paratose 2-epimerase
MGYPGEKSTLYSANVCSHIFCGGICHFSHMATIIVTGSAGLIGSEAVRFFHEKGFAIVGIDNDMRSFFFGPTGSTSQTAQKLLSSLPGYRQENIDIRDREGINALFKSLGAEIKGIIHTAAQPSHDWSALDPHTDFAINAGGTVNLLEATRAFAPESVFLFTSSSKVYGDNPNSLPLVELETRWDLPADHDYFEGIKETMSIDQSKHSFMGASKAAADIMVQEYGRYFGMKTAAFRAGCLTGPAHAGTEWHGFLSYLMKCTVQGTPYQVLGYKGKQVRDNLHSEDLIRAFWEVFQKPVCGEVYNIGSGRPGSCSMREAIELCEEIAGKKLNWSYETRNRNGDHIWWISNSAKFKSHYPNWKCRFGLREILQEINAASR